MKISLSAKNLIALLAGLALSCSGCGGGGGGGGGTLVTPITPPTSISGNAYFSIETPSLTGQTGQSVTVPITVIGQTTVYNAVTDIKVDNAVFESVDGSSSSNEISGLPDGAIARYKWIDSQTIRVMYVSDVGASTGSLLLNVPVKIKSETASTLTLGTTSINQ